MLPVNRFKKILLEQFYLDKDDITVRRKVDGYYGRFKKDDKVIFYKCLKRDGYLGVHIPGTRSTIHASHLLTLLRGFDIPEGSVVDHVDGNPRNNSRENLRVVTQAVNSRNQQKRSNNTSGITGVSWNESGNCWIVRKTLKGVRQYLGKANTLDEARKILQDGYTERHGK